MKSTIAARLRPPARHFHWRRDNSTAPAGFTTLTVEVTEVATVTSCAPTITNCPARSATLSASDLHTYVVTNTVVLTEVVCPVTEAASISKSVIDQHSTGGLPGSTRTAPAVTTPSAAPSIPLSTAGVTNSARTLPPPTAGGDDEEEEDDDCPAEDGDVVTTVTQVVTTKTLTMTVGKGSTASVVTTAIPTTIESTILVTKPAGSATGLVGTDEPTTTTTATSTGTRTVTIKRPNTTGAASPSSGTGLGSDGECSCPAVTVTVPASTVYTASAEAPATTADAGGDDDDEDYDCPADEDVVTLSTTVTVAPYPTNGTVSSGAAKPTGYNKRSNKLF
ncbi:LOW QUALITY PROTEIN: lustrin A-like protein [Colletotrichum tofieldiae]|nr:LOW QUALITY PROTEIN: lustrin A-like protein [Colletotrichum tofieldiae]